MASLISALDNCTPLQVGENGSLEYTWSNNINEQIVQVSFQLTRCRDEHQIQLLASKVRTLLTNLKAQYEASYIPRELYVQYMSVLYRMIGHTRDILEGKGEYTLAFMLLCEWERVDKQLANFAFKHFLLAPENSPNEHPYGCWKDIKYLYKYKNTSSLVDYGLELLVAQLRRDTVTEMPSLAAKWAPREKSQFGLLFTQLAAMYFPQYLESANSDVGRSKATLKAKTEMRKLLSSLNKTLDTVQIKQCGGDWASIDPSKQTSITMLKQKKAFLNVDKHGFQRSPLEDRISCANNFKAFVKAAAAGEVQVKGKRIGLNDFAQEALKLVHSPLSDEAILLNAQWRDNASQTGSLGNMIAMVDTSGSMTGDPLHAALALGIRIAEKSRLGKRVLTFSAAPQWHNLEGHTEFVDMVSVLRDAEWGMNTNFYAAMKMILDVIVSQKLAPDDVEDMVLVILSDMQMDQADSSAKSVMASIEMLYAEAGRQLWNKPFKPPHILFWNLRSSSGFPSLSTQANCSMMSGFSAALLNLFCDEGLNALQSCTPWSLLVKSLDNERYAVLDRFIRETL